MKDEKYGLLPVEDPGFPRGGGANSPGEEAPTYDFANFPKNLHKIERIWTPRGGGVPRAPLRSVTDYKSIKFGGKKNYSQKKN